MIDAAIELVERPGRSALARQQCARALDQVVEVEHAVRALQRFIALETGGGQPQQRDSAIKSPDHAKLVAESEKTLPFLDQFSRQVGRDLGDIVRCDPLERSAILREEQGEIIFDACRIRCAFGSLPQFEGLLLVVRRAAFERDGDRTPLAPMNPVLDDCAPDRRLVVIRRQFQSGGQSRDQRLDIVERLALCKRGVENGFETAF